LQQIDKAANTLRNSVEQFQAFIDGVDNWLTRNRERALTTFKAFDINNTGRVSHDQFKAGMTWLYFDISSFTGLIYSCWTCNIDSIDCTSLHYAFPLSVVDMLVIVLFVIKSNQIKLTILQLANLVCRTLK